MVDRQSSYSYDELITCAEGDLFGPGNAQLPLPPMLMVSRITDISETGGAVRQGLSARGIRHHAGSLVLPLPLQGQPGDARLPGP
jgi:3-hydroxyacyl-[acyl-carrier protein] dehydratase/trans-2-decenoyl-[acyl-carrier protein] isomerase